MCRGKAVPLMKVIICGAGQVGYGIAERLAAENNDVSIIDTSPELVQRVNDMLDVRGFLGHASDPHILNDAGAASEVETVVLEVGQVESVRVEPEPSSLLLLGLGGLVLIRRRRPASTCDKE